MLWAKLSEVNEKTDTRPRTYLYFGGSVLPGWGKIQKSVRDPQLKAEQVPPFRCCDCERTFCPFPEGVGAADQSKPLRQLAAIYWALGLTLLDVTFMLGAFNIQLCYMTVWCDVHALTKTISLPAPPGSMRVLGVNDFYASVKG